jgi:CO/xanthine dehydrogenase Mo-binding subunit
MMTGLLHERELSRTSFLKGGGALVVGLSMLGGAVAGKASAGNYPPPDETQIDTWLAINADNTVTMYPPKMEVGQGTWTGFRQIVAEELDVPVTSISIPRWDTGSAHPFTNNPVSTTVGSNGTANGGPPLRQAAAEARQVLLGLASAQLGVPVSGLSVTDGVVSGGGKSVKYGDLLGGKLFKATITGKAPLKDPSQYKVVGTRVPRFEIPDIVTGAFTYIQNVRIPGMLHGRPVRPRGQANIFATAPDGSLASFKLLSVDESSVQNIPGVQVVRKGNFVGVVAPTEYDAIQAAAQLKVKWAELDTLPGSANLYSATRAAPSRDAQILNYGNVDTAFQSAAKTVSATYEWPFQNHGPIGPVCAIADVRSDGATLFAQGQDGWGSRDGVAQVTGLPLNSIRVIYYSGASTFNRSPNFPCMVDAAIMSQLVGKPVRVQWMRWDMHGWEQYGPGYVADARGALDSKGKILAYDYVSWLPPDNRSYVGALQIGIPQGPDPTTGSSVRGAPDLTAPTTNNPPSGGARFETFSTGDQYFPNIPNRRVTGKTVPNIFYTCPLRAPDVIQPAWGSEQMIDELAHAANMDAYQFRLAHTTHPGWLAALNAVAQASNWKPRVSASQLSSDTIVTGRGIAIAGENHAFSDAYSGAVAEIEVNKKTGKIVVKHLYGAQDSGVIVNPASVENQMSGMLVRGASRTLLEQVQFSKQRVTGLDWVTYPILRFQDHPNVTTIVISRPNEVVPASLSPQGVAGPRYRGAGESLEAVVPPAIANAFFDATGVRMRQGPLTPAKVRAALKAAGVA